MKVKVSFSLTAIFDTIQSGLPALGIDDVETLARDILTEAMENHFDDIKIKKVKFLGEKK